MKKVLLSTIAIIGIVSGTAFAQQAVPEEQAVHSPADGAQHVEAVVSNSDVTTPLTGMMHTQGGHMMGMKGHGKMADTSGMMSSKMNCGKSGMMMEKKGMMHGMSSGMHHGKMRGMKDHGMKGHGMKGHGMMALGFYMPGHEQWTSEQHQQFLDATADLRKDLVVKRFEIAEAKRNTASTPEQFGQLDKDLIDIRTNLQVKALEINAVAAE